MQRFMPKTATTSQIQTQYRALFDEIIEKKEPLLILNKNKPEVVIIDVKSYEILLENNEKYEQKAAQQAIDKYGGEKQQGKLQKLGSLADLM